jgi:hypothetical protein
MGGLAVSSDGSTLYVGLRNAIAVFQTTPDMTNPLKPIGQVNVGGNVESVAGIAVGRKFPYVAAILQEPGVQPGQVLLLDPNTLHRVAPSLGTGNLPVGLAVSGLIIYATMETGITVYAPGALGGGVGC